MNRYEEEASSIIGKRIRTERLNKHMTQSEFAHMLGISASYLGALERGTRPVSRSVMENLHSMTNISYDYLLEGEMHSPLTAHNAICEPEHYQIRRSFGMLMHTCSPEELEECYRLVRTYLSYLHSKNGHHNI